MIEWLVENWKYALGALVLVGVIWEGAKRRD